MREKLKTLYKIQQVLQENGYYDISRISEEIYDFCLGDENRITAVLERIGENEPWDYIRGETEFCGNIFIVTKSVLIPRVETEKLVQVAIKLLERGNYHNVIDIGTGSGCIIISLAKYFNNNNDISFLGTDICKRALSIAMKNAMLHKVNEKVAFLQQDLLSETVLEDGTLLLANLPYIPTDMYEELEKSVKDYEPQKALDGGSDGLKYYKKLFKKIEEEKRKVSLIIEYEPSTEKELEKILPKESEYISDFNGVNRFALIHFSQDNH